MTIKIQYNSIEKNTMIFKLHINFIPFIRQEHVPHVKALKQT